jgi:hypothetical protein
MPDTTSPEDAQRWIAEIEAGHTVITSVQDTSVILVDTPSENPDD